MCWMVADSKLLLDQLGYAAPGPDVAKKAVRFGPLPQQFNQMRELVGTQRGRATGWGMIRQRRWVIAASARQPLTNSPLRHPQRRSDADLGPALLVEFPGALAAKFAPTALLGRIGGAHKPQQSISWPTSIRSLCSYQ